MPGSAIPLQIWFASVDQLNEFIWNDGQNARTMEGEMWSERGVKVIRGVLNVLLWDKGSELRDGWI